MLSKRHDWRATELKCALSTLTPRPVLLPLNYMDRQCMCSATTGTGVQYGTEREETLSPTALLVYDISGGVCVKRTAKCPWVGQGRSRAKQLTVFGSDGRSPRHWTNLGSLIHLAVLLWAIYLNLLTSIFSSVKRG